jgi:Domain of unknown function (DUF4439)
VNLTDALAAEHAAIWGYGVAGGHLAAGALDLARQSEAAHRDRRDVLIEQLSGAGDPPPAAAPAYDLPFPVTDQASALRLAVQIEERTGAVWRATLPQLTGDARRAPLNALTDCAVRAARWRRLTGQTPGTVALPGTSS